jgi:uncharacterized protein YybS (DUF2232 family)
MARTWIIPAGAGVLSALLFLSAGVGSPGAMILSNLAPLPLFAMGLGAGLVSALAAGTSAAVLIGAVGVNAGLSRGDPIDDSTLTRLIPAATFAVMIVTPTVVLVRQALLSRIDASGRLEWYPSGRLVMWLVGIGMAAFLVAISFVSGGRPVEERLNRVFSSALSAYAGPAMAAQLQYVTDILSALPAIIALMWLLLMVFNGVLAQGLLVRFQHNLRPSPPMSSIELPRSAGIITAVAVGLTILASGWLEFVARNLLMLLGLAFFFAGLGVVHGLLRQSAQRVAALIGFYVFVLMFFYPVMMVVALVGFIDHWAHFRQRFGGSAPGAV